MRTPTVNTTTVQLLKRGSSTPVRATVRYDAATRTAVLDPAASLARGATYTATVRRGARDLSANYLAAARSWSFTVRR